ncbi:unnamed protein product [Callosobruchus maculatus]|uniref:Uncharacterized protein n=1 Tax=Callosobruchus maculatus TaxID=64391 RepID=A0A653DEE2_CALMS|nr:unnamed protein product [Callosobruchus maculatus]
MAKAEKRISRRLPAPTEENSAASTTGGSEQHCQEYSRDFQPHRCSSLRALPVLRTCVGRTAPRRHCSTTTRRQMGKWMQASKALTCTLLRSIRRHLQTGTCERGTVCPAGRYHPKYPRGPPVSHRGRWNHVNLMGLRKQLKTVLFLACRALEVIAASPQIGSIWKRKGNHVSEYAEPALETSLSNISDSSFSSYTLVERNNDQQVPQSYKISETIRKRQYRGWRDS